MAAKNEDEKNWLAEIVGGVVHKPPRILLYGIHGIGKSTLAADAPNPIFIPTEDGANEIDVPKFPVVTSTDEVLEQLRSLYKGTHEYETVVIDSADWLEDFIQLELKASYSEKELSFGKDSLRAAEKMSEVLTALNHVREKRGMGCILIAHTEIKGFNSPMSEPYDRYQPKLQSRMGGLLQEWADLVAFATYDVVVKKEDLGHDKSARRGISTGERVLFVEERPAFYAKNRYGMPVEIPFHKEHPYAEVAQYIPFYSAKEATKADKKPSSKDAK